MTPERRQELVLLRRARDLIDRRFAEPLDVPAIAASVHLSAAHFSRRFRAVHGETPYSYLMTRRIERACAMLRAGASVTEELVVKGALGPWVFATDDLDALFGTAVAAGAEVVSEPTDQPWGPRDAAFRDPSGNVVRVLQR